MMRFASHARDNIFRDRRDAGQRLADKLLQHRGQPSTLVLALPRGGVPVAYEVAKGLLLPLDILLVRKLGVPGQEELAMGALSEDGITVIDDGMIAKLGIAPSVLEDTIAREQAELKRRAEVYRAGSPTAVIAGKTVILIDDGLATGSSMRAAVRAVRARGAKRLLIAVPVGPAEFCGAFDGADEMVCVLAPAEFRAVGSWYEDFPQTSDAEVIELLSKAKDRDGVPKK